MKFRERLLTKTPMAMIMVATRAHLRAYDDYQAAITGYRMVPLLGPDGKQIFRPK